MRAPLEYCGSVQFSWDERKAETNLRKHGISFRDAARVFVDPHVVLVQDRVVEEELRWHAIGKIGANLTLLVVHTVEGDREETIRLISARRANANERAQYEHGDHDS